MKKVQIYRWGQAAVFILAVIVLLAACISSNQAAYSIPIPMKFVGEYSTDNGATWKPLEDNTEISALDSDLFLRGNFEMELFEDTPMNFYLDHITMEIFVNGEISFIDSRNEMGLTSSGCCKQWLSWITPEVTADDTVEIHLRNPHSFGNKNAYSEFLSSIYCSSYLILSNYMEQYGKTYHIIGLAVIVTAIVLLGMGLASWLLKIDDGKAFGQLGFLALFAGGYIALDTIDLSLWSELNAFNTYALHICMMLAGLGAAARISDSIKSGHPGIGLGTIVCSILTNAVLLVLSLTGVMVIYDTKKYWLAAYALIFAVLLTFSIYEYAKTRKNHLVFISHILLITSILMDMTNLFTEWYPSGLCSKVAFLIIYAVNLVRILWVTTLNYRAARQAEKMTAELQNSRMTLMLSKIQPHFLCNSLNIIFCLCRKNPENAQKAINNLSDYLRMNYDLLTCHTSIPFSTELEHIKSYVSLEKLRFEDLTVNYDIGFTNFTVPPLSIEPLVENAIKHGLEKKWDGCLTLSTREYPEYIEIKIADNGTGFDVNKLPDDGRSHIGLEFSRSRLCEVLDADFTIDSKPGNGTEITIRISKENVCHEDNCGR